MKKLFIVTMFTALFVAEGLGQENLSQSGNNYTINPQDYSLKAKHQKTAAWICLGGGFLLATTGVVIAVNNTTNDLFNIFSVTPTYHDYTTESVLMITGTAGMLGAIPLFISAANNKRRARLSIDSQKTAFGLPGHVSRKISGITLTIPIGK